MKIYELLNPPSSASRTAKDIIRMGPGAMAACEFIVINGCTGLPFSFELVRISAELNRELPDHHPMFDQFTETDLQAVWEYMLSHKMLREIIGH